MFTASSCQNSHQCWDPSNFQERNHVGDWGTQEEKAFANAKICQRLVLVHFISKWPLLLACDAFEFGIIALLAYTRWYRTPNWLCFKIIVTSRMQPYSQLKKKELSVCVLFGHRFLLYTNHKLLFALLNEYRSTLP